MKKWLPYLFATLSVSSLCAHIFIDDVMDEAEQQKTGVYNLTHNQKQELEAWLNRNFVLKNKNEEPSEEPVATLTFDLVLANGKYVQLSDQTLYEIAPDDIAKTAVWLLPFPIEVKESGDPNYPLLLVNENTGESVKAKKIVLAPTENTPTP